MGSYKCYCLSVFLIGEILLLLAFFLGGCYGPSDVRFILGMYLVTKNVVTALTFWLDKGFASGGYDESRIAEVVLFLMAWCSHRSLIWNVLLLLLS